MKMSKKMLSIILAIMMIVTIVPITASAATHTLSIVADKTNVNIGDTVKISVTISQKSNLGCLTVDIKYDAFAFEAVSLKGAGLFTTDAVHGMEMANVKYQTGKARFVAVGEYALEEGGTLFIAEFKAIRAGVCDFALAIEESLDTNNSVVDIVANTVNVTVVEGSTIEPEEPPKPSYPSRRVLEVATDKTAVNVGDEVSVTVSLGEKTGISTLTIKSNYDETVLKAVDMKAGDLGATVNVKTGVATMATATTFETEGTVCTMTFKAIKTGSTDVSFVILEATDIDLKNVSIDINSVNISVFDTCTDGHTWSTWVVEKDAECNSDGIKGRNCTVCGENETEVIPATGHSYESVVTAPTCTEQGYT
ncbi:MAG: hypothetical protein II244_07685, partial [Clostridia bacterium]|nr:hypothetical protein [Clostridia bacterium]